MCTVAGTRQSEQSIDHPGISAQETTKGCFGLPIANQAQPQRSDLQNCGFLTRKRVTGGKRRLS
jgi:hypothetical protein